MARNGCIGDPLIGGQVAKLYQDIVSADYTVDCKKIRSSYIAGIIVIAFSLVSLAVSYLLDAATRLPRLISIMLILLGILFMMRLRIGVALAKRERATEAEQELPYFSLLLTVVSALGQPIYTGLRIARNFDILKRTNRDIMFIRKIAILYRLSILEAMRVASRVHPSLTVADFYRTVVLAERAGGDRYTFYYNLTISMMKVIKDRIDRMVEKFSNVVNILLIAFVVVPVAAVTLSALFAGDRGLNVIIFATVFYPILVAMILATFLGNMIPKELRDPVDPKDSIRYGLTFAILAILIFIGLSIIPSEILPLHIRVFISIAAPLLLIFGPLYRKIRYYQKLDTFTPFLARYLEEETKKGNQPLQALSNLLEISSQEEMGGDKRVLDPEIYKLVGKIVFKSRVLVGEHEDDIRVDDNSKRGKGTDKSDKIEAGPIKRAIEGILLPWPLRMVFEYMDLFTRLGGEPRSASVIADFIDGVYSVKKIIAERAGSFFVVAMMSVIVMAIGFTIVNNLVLPQVAGIEVPETQYTGFTIQPIDRELLAPIKELSYTNVLINSILISMLLSKMSRGTIQYGFIYGLILVIVAFGFIMMLDTFVSI